METVLWIPYVLEGIDDAIPKLGEDNPDALDLVKRAHFAVEDARQALFPIMEAFGMREIKGEEESPPTPPGF
jgi:hypothetical protein